MSDIPQETPKKSAFDVLVERVHYLVDTLELSQTDSRQSLAVDYIRKYLPVEIQQDAYERICNDPHQFIEDEIKSIFRDMDTTKRTGFLKGFVLGTISKYTVSDLITLLELGCFDADMDVHGGSLIASLADHAPLILPSSKRPWESLDESLSDDDKRYVMRGVYELLFAYGADPNSTYSSVGSGDVERPITCFDLLVLDELGKKDPKGHTLVTVIQWMCKNGLELEPTKEGELSKLQMVAELPNPVAFLSQTIRKNFIKPRMMDAIATLAENGADIRLRFPGEKSKADAESFEYLLSRDGKSIVELYEDYERAMELALQHPEEFKKVAISNETQRSGWSPDISDNIQDIEGARCFYRNMTRALRELYKEKGGLTQPNQAQAER